jgi:hypothetical protein
MSTLMVSPTQALPGDLQLQGTAPMGLQAHNGRGRRELWVGEPGGFHSVEPVGRRQEAS